MTLRSYIPTSNLSESFPLEQLFEAVRQEGISIGIEELLSAQEALQYGLGGETAASLANLLKMLWLGSREEFGVFDKCFHRYLELVGRADALETKNINWEDTTRSLESEEKLSYGDDIPHEEVAPPVETPDPGPPPRSSAPAEEASISLAAGSKEVNPGEFPLVRQHDPSSPLSLRRNWQKLKSEHPSYSNLDLDVHATVLKIARKGYFDEPVFVPRLKKELNLLLFIDAGGSMVPLMDYVTRWQETVLSNVRFKEARKCYFRNVPENEIYLDHQLKEAIPLRRFWSNIATGRTIALVISDIGAARKSWDSGRILECRDFSRALHQKGFSQLWLNPMRRNYWEGSSAAKVAEYVPQMLSLDPAGTRQAIAYLNQQMERRQP